MCYLQIIYIYFYKYTKSNQQTNIYINITNRIMKYFEALKIYNEGKQTWCSPRKGSDDYKEVIAIMKSKLKSSTKSPLKSPLKSPMKSPLYKEIDVSSKKPSSKSLLFNKANVIQRFLKNKLILTKNNLDTRVQRYHLIKKRFGQLT